MKEYPDKRIWVIWEESMIKSREKCLKACLNETYEESRENYLK